MQMLVAVQRVTKIPKNPHSTSVQGTKVAWVTQNKLFLVHLQLQNKNFKANSLKWSEIIYFLQGGLVRKW